MGVDSRSASRRSASSRRPINRRRRASSDRACAALTRSPCASRTRRAFSSAFVGLLKSRETNAISASATTHRARATTSLAPKARTARRSSAFARARSPSCAIARPRRASAGASSRSAARFKEPRGLPAARACAAAVISESIRLRAPSAHRFGETAVEIPPQLSLPPCPAQALNLSHDEHTATRLEWEKAMNLEQKTVLITGANRGIGRALVDEALARGASRVYAGTRGALQHVDERVTAVRLDVRSTAQIQAAVAQVHSLDVLVNNAGVAIYDDLRSFDVIEQHLAVNLMGTLKVTHAFLPLLRRSSGAIVNNLSLAALAALPILPGYSISKAAAFSATQSLRAFLTAEGVTVHAVILGPIDTDMNRGLEIPKASAETAARGIFDGLQRGEQEIFPDPVSESVAGGWRTGALKELERQFAAFVQRAA